MNKQLTNQQRAVKRAAIQENFKWAFGFLFAAVLAPVGFVFGPTAVMTAVTSFPASVALLLGSTLSGPSGSFCSTSFVTFTALAVLMGWVALVMSGKTRTKK